MAILHLICGLSGSWKTTLWKKIESETNAIRFCPDEWIKYIWESAVEGNRHRDQIEQVQWNLGKKILHSWLDIIIEWWTWGKDERDRLRIESHNNGVKVYFYYLDIPKEILKSRILKRNVSADWDELQMSEETLDKEIERCFFLFQIPDEKELGTYDKYYRL